MLFILNGILYFLSMKNVFFDRKEKNGQKDKFSSVLGSNKMKCFSTSCENSQLLILALFC